MTLGILLCCLATVSYAAEYSELKLSLSRRSSSKHCLGGSGVSSITVDGDDVKLKCSPLYGKWDSEAEPGTLSERDVKTAVNLNDGFKFGETCLGNEFICAAGSDGDDGLLLTCCSFSGISVDHASCSQSGTEMHAREQRRHRSKRRSNRRSNQRGNNRRSKLRQLAAPSNSQGEPVSLIRSMASSGATLHARFCSYKVEGVEYTVTRAFKHSHVAKSSTTSDLVVLGEQTQSKAGDSFTMSCDDEASFRSVTITRSGDDVLYSFRCYAVGPGGESDSDDSSSTKSDSDDSSSTKSDSDDSSSTKSDSEKSTDSDETDSDKSSSEKAKNNRRYYNNKRKSSSKDSSDKSTDSSGSNEMNVKSRLTYWTQPADDNINCAADEWACGFESKFQDESNELNGRVYRLKCCRCSTVKYGSLAYTRSFHSDRDEKTLYGRRGDGLVGIRYSETKIILVYREIVQASEKSSESTESESTKSTESESTKSSSTESTDSSEDDFLDGLLAQVNQAHDHN